jgi:hypothetical protein
MYARNRQLPLCVYSVVLAKENAPSLTGDRDQGRRLVVIERTSNYQYLTLCMYQLTETIGGGVTMGCAQRDERGVAPADCCNLDEWGLLEDK